MAAFCAEAGLLGDEGQGCYRLGELPLDPDFAALAWCGVVIVEHVDANLRKDGLVEPALLLVGGGVVQLVGSTEELKHQLDAFLCDFDVVLADANQALAVFDLCRDAGLAGFQVFLRYDTVKVGVDEALFLALQCDESPALSVGQGTVIFLMQGELFARQASHLGDDIRCELDAVLPIVHDLAFDIIDGNVGQVAGRAASVAAETEEVGVDATLPA